MSTRLDPEALALLAAINHVAERRQSRAAHRLQAEARIKAADLLADLPVRAEAWFDWAFSLLADEGYTTLVRDSAGTPLAAVTDKGQRALDQGVRPLTADLSPRERLSALAG